MSKAAELAALIGSQSALSNRNLIINGAMQVAQRGTSFAAPNGTYTLDRMRCAQANAADTISQQTFTAGQTDVPGSPKNYLRFAFGAATANRVLETRIEDVYTLSGQSITLSFYAKASAAHTSTIEMTQYFGSGGSSAVAFGTQSYDITTSWQRFEFSLSCPSISGKTIGAGNYLSAAFIRSLSAGPSINVDIALLQLEVGEQDTPFEHRSYGDELNRCRRYTQVFLGDQTFSQIGGTGIAWSTTTIDVPVPLIPQMRSTPSLTNSGNLQASNGASGFALSAISLVTAQSSTDIASVRGTTSGMTAGNPHRIEAANNTTARVILSAEL
jgi:hypothetical protein